MSLPEDYDWYLKTNHWQKLREQKLASAGYQCERCGEFAKRGLGGEWALLQVHHKTYERMPWRELPEDLEALCGPCHAAHHGHELVKQHSLSVKIAARTCGWTPEELDYEVSQWDELVEAAGC